MKTIARVASLFAAALLTTTPRAAVLVVNTTADTNGACAPEHCSLREAINAANLTGALDEIHFNIPGAGPHEIVPSSLLPDITTPVTIDGYTQPGSKPNTMVQSDNSVHKIVVRWGVGATSWGLRFWSLADIPGPSGSTVRGLVIHSFDRNVYLLLGKPNPIAIEGNFLGTDVTGKAYGATGIGNGNGIVVQYSFNGAPVVANSRIGGLDPADRNVISVYGYSTGILIGPANGTVIQGNFIGVDASGSAALGNGGGGIYCYPCDEITIGGAEKGARNVIAGNAGEVFIYTSAGGAKIQGNYSGTDATGRTRLGGGNGAGVNWYISTGTTVGGTAPGEGNVIAYNNMGVGHAANGGGAGNRIRGNSIHDSQFAASGANRLGIDIRGDGITPNDACEANPNLGQNFPVLTGATVGASGITIDGSLNSLPGASYTIDFYASASCDPSGHGEGALFLGSTDVTTAGDCIAPFTVSFPGSLPPGSSIAATALDAAGNTSEFSACTALSGNGGASGAVPDGSAAGTVPLTLEKTAGSDLTLSWDDSCTVWDDDYEVLEGDFGSWYSHVPVVCSTGGATTAAITPGAGDTYYLVVPTNGSIEGSHGLDGAGDERPQGLIACHGQLIAACP